MSTPDEVMLSFEIPGLPPSPNKIKTVHDKISVKKEWQDIVAAAAVVAKHKERLKGVYDACHVHFDIYVDDNRRHDPDNLAWSVTKPTLDALTPSRDKRIGRTVPGILLKDDNIDCITLSYSYYRSGPRRFVVTLTGY